MYQLLTPKFRGENLPQVVEPQGAETNPRDSTIQLICHDQGIAGMVVGNKDSKFCRISAYKGANRSHRVSLSYLSLGYVQRAGVCETKFCASLGSPAPV